MTAISELMDIFPPLWQDAQRLSLPDYDTSRAFTNILFCLGDMGPSDEQGIRKLFDKWASLIDEGHEEAKASVRALIEAKIQSLGAPQ